MKLILENRKARFNYFLEDFFEAGIALAGSEVKSLRANKVSLEGAYVSIINGEVFLKNCEIAVYDKTASYKPDVKRVRKLLLHKSQIAKLKQKLVVKGLTIIPTKIYLNNQGYVKIEIATAKGKHLYDKKQVLKERDILRSSGLK